MTENFNIKDNDWDLLYSHHFVHANTLRKITNLFDLELFMPISQVLTRYINNLNESNSVIDLIFL